MGGSYWLGSLRIGLLVLLLHDSSDIIADLLKMSNYMGFDEQSGLYLTELLFVSNLICWLYLRMWLFPFHVIATVAHDANPYFHVKDGVFSMASYVGIKICLALLCVLACMHIYWWMLFMRIAVRLVNPKKKDGSATHDAAKEEYEGTSDSDNGGDAQKPVTRKKAGKTE